MNYLITILCILSLVNFASIVVLFYTIKKLNKSMHSFYRSTDSRYQVTLKSIMEQNRENRYLLENTVTTKQEEMRSYINERCDNLLNTIMVELYENYELGKQILSQEHTQYSYCYEQFNQCCEMFAEIKRFLNEGTKLNDISNEGEN